MTEEDAWPLVEVGCFYRKTCLFFVTQVTNPGEYGSHLETFTITV